MKKYLIPFFGLVLATSILFSCGTDSASLEGNWATKSAKLESTAFNEALATAVEAEYARTNLSFGTDGTVQLTRGNKVQKGVYVLGKGDALTLKSAEGDAQKWSEECTIKSQGEAEMTLVCKVDEKGSTATLIMEKK